MKQKNKKKDFKKFVAKAHRRSKTKKADFSDMANGPFRQSQTRRDEKTVVGRFSAAKGGFGFVSPETGGEDIFIPQGKTGGAWEGDTVEAVYHTYRSYSSDSVKTDGRVVRIVEEASREVIGTLEKAKPFGRRSAKVFLFRADDRRLSVTPTVPDPGNAGEGDKVQVLIRREKGEAPTAEILRNFGRSDSRIANYDAILAENSVETDFSEEELSQAEEVAAESIDFENRVDLRDEKIMTIDGAGAKDLDDAVSLRRGSNGKWILTVSIADVSHYVTEKTPLDRAVMRRGTSIYFTDKVVPMLPEALSNGACSLNAGEDKAALSAKMTLSPEGEILKTEVFPSVIRSRVRGVYSEVNDLFDNGKKSDFYEKYAEMYTTLCKMKELFAVLAKRSRDRGAMDFDIAEAVIDLGEDGMPTDVRPCVRGDAEKMIEQFMLAANEGVAILLTERGIPCVYRVHGNPPEDKRDSFIQYAHNLGFDTSSISKEKCSAKDFSSLLAEAEEKGIGTAVSYALLRTMAKAEYSEIAAPHFGLSIPLYCHFTSPIRRLSDLATHRIIHRVLLEGAPANRYAGYAKRAAAAATDGELRALSAERKIDDLYKALFMAKHLGEFFDATVTSVNAFGVFASLDNTCEGLIPTSELPGVFFYDEKTQTLRSRDLFYRPGDRIRICVEEVDVSRGKVRFSDGRFDLHGQRSDGGF